MSGAESWERGAEGQQGNLSASEFAGLPGRVTQRISCWRPSCWRHKIPIQRGLYETGEASVCVGSEVGGCLSCPIVAQHGLSQMLEETGVGGAGEQPRCNAGVHFSLLSQQTDANASRTAMPLACRSRYMSRTDCDKNAESFQSMLPFFHCADYIPPYSLTACQSNSGINVRHLGVRVDAG